MSVNITVICCQAMIGDDWRWHTAWSLWAMNQIKKFLHQKFPGQSIFLLAGLCFFQKMPSTLFKGDLEAEEWAKNNQNFSLKHPVLCNTCFATNTSPQMLYNTYFVTHPLQHKLCNTYCATFTLQQILCNTYFETHTLEHLLYCTYFATWTLRLILSNRNFTFCRAQLQLQLQLELSSFFLTHPPGSIIL